MDLPALILGPYPELEPVVKRIFNIRAAEERDKRRMKQPFSATAIVPGLECRLRAFEASCY